MATAAPDISPIQHTNENMDNAVANAQPEDTKSSTTPPAFDDPHNIRLDHLCQDISELAASLCAIDKSEPLETPKYVDDFLDAIESKLQYYESVESPARFGHSIKDSTLLLKAIDRLALLIDSVSKFRSVSNSAAILLNLATCQLHRAMLILGDELTFLLLHIPPPNNNASVAVPHEQQQEEEEEEEEEEEDFSQQQQQESEYSKTTFPPYSSEDISMITSIIKSMILAGYRVECMRLFVIARRGALEEELESQGLEKMSIDDVQRMQWEALEGEIGTWIRVFKRCTSYLFPGELEFYQAIFSSALSNIKPKSHIWMVLFSDLASSVIHQLINLAHAVAMTKRSSEKLFKFLDMHEMLRDLGLWLDDSSFTEDCIQELRSELAAASTRLGQAAVSIVCELIKTDNTKQPVACGAVDPLTHNTMDYLNYACEYKDTLEELFQRHHIINTSNTEGEDDVHIQSTTTTTPFTAQLLTMMSLLDANLEVKSNLYKDPSLRYIFLMNNVRYMLQKIKGSTQMHHSLWSSSWCRKRSTDVRTYHKNYQRDTWSKVLQCLAQEGLLVNGKVQKPVLKERFKNFNQLFDEIHKTQSIWVVSDEQLQSELRVSITAVMIPAYRAFLARFGHISGYEKHIKYQPEDIEAAIEDLFDGNSN